MRRRRRITAGFLHESQMLARGLAHLLEVLKDRHPDRDEARLALRCTLELEAVLTEQAAQLGRQPSGAQTREADHARG